MKLGVKEVNKLIDLSYKEYAESLSVLIARTPYQAMSVIKCVCWYNKPGEVRIYLKDLNNNDLGHIAIKNTGTVELKISGHIRHYIENCITALNNVFRLEHSTSSNNINKPVLCFNCQTNIAVKDGLCNRCY